MMFNETHDSCSYKTWRIRSQYTKKRLRRAAFYQDLGNPDPYLEEV